MRRQRRLSWELVQLRRSRRAPRPQHMCNALYRYTESAMQPAEAIRQGRAALDPVLEPHGFQFVEGDADVGSGGAFAQAAYVRGSRRLSFSYRRALGLVTYSIGSRHLEHADFVRAASNAKGAGHYPGFGSDPLAAFKDLADDIREFGGLFLGSDDALLQGLFDRAAANPRPAGIAAIERGAV